MLKTKVINTCDNSVRTVDLRPRSRQQSECLIGRHPNCDLVLDGPAVSRVHGRMLFEGGRCFFTDLGSTDGSRLNNEQAQVNQVYAIAPDDAIRIGEFVLMVESMTPAGLVAEQSPWPDKIAARCVQIIQETSDVKTFRFVAEPAVLFDFKPGQFVCIELPISDAKGDPITRSYSISSSPARPHTLDITVKRVGSAGDGLPQGVASNWLHDVFEAGMTLSMQGPFGAFNCVDNPSDKLLLISAGSGITPMMSMAQWLSDCPRQAGSALDIAFIHTARSVQDLIFRQRLDLLAAQHPGFRLAFSLTQDLPAVPWAGYRGRLNPALLTAICPDFVTRNAFVCGPEGFMRSTKALLAGEGFPRDRYFEESFGGSSVADSVGAMPAAALSQIQQQASNSTIAGSAPTVEFAASGKVVTCDESDTLLAVAEGAGVKLASGCRMGSCGACKCVLAGGEVSYAVEPRGLSEGDRAGGQVLACIAKPIGRAVLDL